MDQGLMSDGKRRGPGATLLAYVWRHRWWWLVSTVILLLLLGVLCYFAQSDALSPWLYPVH